MGALPLPHFRRYLSLAGRSGRLEWWVIDGLVAAAYSVLDDINRMLGDLGIDDAIARILLILLLSSPITWLSFSSIVRRLHDRDKSGWWALLYAFPLLGQIWLFIECGFLPGRDQGKRFDAVAKPDTSHLTVQRVRPPSRLLMIVTATLAVGLLASTCMTVRVTEVGPNDRLPGMKTP